MKGATIKRLRSIQGISQSELAFELDISQSYLSQIESDRKRPSDDLMAKIKEILMISMFFHEDGR